MRRTDAEYRLLVDRACEYEFSCRHSDNKYGRCSQVVGKEKPPIDRCREVNCGDGAKHHHRNREIKDEKRKPTDRSFIEHAEAASAKAEQHKTEHWHDDVENNFQEKTRIYKAKKRRSVAYGVRFCKGFGGYQLIFVSKYFAR